MSLVRRESVFPLSRWTRTRRSGIGSLESPLLAKATSLIGEDGEPVAANHFEIARLHHPQAHVALGARDEEGPGPMNGGPPLVMDVALVEDIGRAADDA